MQPQQLYELWTRSDAPWSAWVKPVLFAHIGGTSGDADAERVLDAARALRLDWAPSADDRIAIVVDLTGEESLSTGLALALRGYQPVPLFNSTIGPQAVIGLEGVVDLLRASALVLSEAPMERSSPPVFLLDSRRMRGTPSPKMYDNRWMTFPQDFPSAATLLRYGVREVMLVLEQAGRPADDLRHILARWQEGGVRMLAIDPARFRGDERPRPEPITITRPFGFRLMWRRALAMLGLRRNAAGGFGAIVPNPSTGSGGFGGGFG